MIISTLCQPVNEVARRVSHQVGDVFHDVMVTCYMVCCTACFMCFDRDVFQTWQALSQEAKERNSPPLWTGARIDNFDWQWSKSRQCLPPPLGANLHVLYWSCTCIAAAEHHNRNRSLVKDCSVMNCRLTCTRASQFCSELQVSVYSCKAVSLTTSMTPCWYTRLTCM